MPVRPEKQLETAGRALASLGIDLNFLLESTGTSVPRLPPQTPKHVPRQVARQVPPQVPTIPILPAPPQPPSAVGTNPKSERMCNHWLLNRCEYGDACKFSHDGPGGPAAGFEEAISKEEAELEAQIEQAQIEQAAAEERILEQEANLVDAELAEIELIESTTAASRPSRFCTHWARFSCEYGDACNFSHEGPGGPRRREPSPPVIVPAPARPVVVAARYRPDPNPGIPPARYSSQIAPAQEARICTHWQKNRCNYGDLCRFIHKADSRKNSPY